MGKIQFRKTPVSDRGASPNATTPGTIGISFGAAPSGHTNWIESSPLGGGVDIRYGAADIGLLLTNALPKTKEKRLERCGWHAENDDFLGGIINIKKKYGCRGFMLTCSKPGAMILDKGQDTAALKEQSEAKEVLRKLSVERNLTGIVKELMRCWFTYDSMILYWRVEEVSADESVNDLSPVKKKALARIKQIMALDPRDCVWQNDQLQDQLCYRLPPELYQRIHQAIRAGDNGIKQLIADGIPLDWINAVRKQQRIVVLKRSDGHNWIVRTDGPAQLGLTWPSMYGVFLYLEMRRAIRDGDFVAGYMMKHFIQHVTMGESITQGPMAGSQTNWATPDEIDKMHKVFKECTKAARLVTNHTVKIDYVHPPKEMFDVAKYGKSETAIMHQQHVSTVLLTGAGATNSSGYIGIQTTKTDLEDCRNEVDQVWQLFFAHETVVEAMDGEIPDDYYVSTQFDQNCLKDPRQLLDEIKTLISNHMMGAETALTELGRDPNRVRMEKQVDKIYNENTDVFEPLSKAAPLQEKDEGGRPPRPSTTQDEDTRRQPATL